MTSRAWEGIDRAHVMHLFMVLTALQERAPREEVAEVLRTLTPLRNRILHAEPEQPLDSDSVDLLRLLARMNRTSLGSPGARRLQRTSDASVIADILSCEEPAKAAAVPTTEARPAAIEHTRHDANAVGSYRATTTTSSRTAVGLGQAVRTAPAGALPANMVPHPKHDLFSVLLVNDHPLLREAIAARLTQMGAGTVHEAASVAEARARALATGPCDLAILDLGLPDGSGIELVTELRSHGWPRIVVLASSDDPYAVRSAFQAGAQAYLLKSASPVVVTDGVRRVLEGGVYADPSVAPVLATGTRVPGTDNTPRELSAREVEVLQLVADGQSNKEIGEALNLSALTVKSHLSRIGRKLGTGDRAQMVALAMRAGVIR